jgi:hypothetical protein
MAIYKGRRPWFSSFIRYPHNVNIPRISTGVPTDGTSGTGAGVDGPGSLYINYATGIWYINTNTKASPTWTAGASLSGAITPTTVVASGAISGTTITGSGAITTTGATASSGYATGAGGAVTQITNASTGVTLSKPCGQITTVALTTAGAAEERFTVTNTLVTATDTITLGTTYNGGGTPMVGVLKVAAGAFDIVITNLSASALDDVMVINFAIHKAVAA